MTERNAREARIGALAGLAAFLAWGVLPLYYKWFGAVPALEILAHRVVWTVVVTAALVAGLGRFAEIEAVVRSRRKLGVFLGSASLISVNWGLYIWSVANGRLLEASMGYFIFPLVAVMLGALFLRERLNRRETAAIALVVAGVGYMVWSFGELPWIALTLAVTFGSYGLLRKIAPADSLAGLFVEACVLAPVALVYLLVLPGGGAFGSGAEMAFMLALAGPATAVPLLLFAFAARRMRMATLGLMQYLNPTIQMVIAAGLFGETFTATHAVTFACIWTGLLIYSGGGFAIASRARKNRVS